MTKLVRLLRQAHAIEVGAYNAYEGHWRSLPRDSMDQNTVKAMQADEAIHKENIERMLKEIGGKPSWMQDTIVWIIGKTISIGCYVIGYKMAMWGAHIMEHFGGLCYRRLASVARDEGHPAMAVELEYMQRAEEDHKRFITICLERTKELNLKTRN